MMDHYTDGHLVPKASEKESVLVRKPEGKITVEWPRGRWKDNIKMDLQEIDRRTWT